MIEKSLLERMERVPLGKPFNRQNLAAFRLSCKNQAGIHRLAVEQHRAGAAFAFFAASFYAEITFAPQHVQQKISGRDRPLPDGSVYGRAHHHGFHKEYPACSAHSSKARPTRTRHNSRRNSAVARRSSIGLTARMTSFPASASSA